MQASGSHPRLFAERVCVVCRLIMSYSVMMLTSLGHSRHLVLLLFVMVLSMSTMGGVISSEMMLYDGTMQNCPFMGVAALCQMNPLEHLVAWQSMFSAIATNAANVFLLLLLLTLILLMRIVGRLPFKEHLDRLAVRERQYTRHSLAFAHANPLQEALSQGILNPKVY